MKYKTKQNLQKQNYLLIISAFSLLLILLGVDFSIKLSTVKGKDLLFNLLYIPVFFGVLSLIFLLFANLIDIIGDIINKKK